MTKSDAPSLLDLQRTLAATIDALAAGKMDARRGQAIAANARQIINGARLALDYAGAIGARPYLPLLSPSAIRLAERLGDDLWRERRGMTVNARVAVNNTVLTYRVDDNVPIGARVRCPTSWGGVFVGEVVGFGTGGYDGPVRRAELVIIPRPVWPPASDEAAIRELAVILERLVIVDEHEAGEPLARMILDALAREP